MDHDIYDAEGGEIFDDVDQSDVNEFLNGEKYDDEEIEKFARGWMD